MVIRITHLCRSQNLKSTDIREKELCRQNSCWAPEEVIGLPLRVKLWCEKQTIFLWTLESHPVWPVRTHPVMNCSGDSWVCWAPGASPFAQSWTHLAFPPLPHPFLKLRPKQPKRCLVTMASGGEQTVGSVLAREGRVVSVCLAFSLSASPCLFLCIIPLKASPPVPAPLLGSLVFTLEREVDFTLC